MALADDDIVKHDLGDGGDLYIITPYKVFPQLINFLEMQGFSLSVLPDNKLHVPVMGTANGFGFQVSLWCICGYDGMFSCGYRNIVNNDGRDGVDLYPIGDQGIKVEGIRIPFMVEGVYEVLHDFP